MLKIKDSVDLKELEKFGYKIEEFDDYYRKEEKGYAVQINIYDREILVFKLRENSDWGDYIGQRKEDEYKLKTYIQDLIQAGLVEKSINI